MSMVTNMIRALRALFRSGEVERELDEELQDFLAASIAEKMRRGMTPEEAARAARVEMGSSNVVKHRIRSIGWEATMENLWHDLRYSLRTLAKSPAFTLVAVLSLALGIGANTAIFTLVRQVILQQLPVGDPEQLVSFGNLHASGMLGGVDLSFLDMYTYDFARQLEAAPGPFAGVGSYASMSPRVNLRVPGAALAIQREATLVSGNFFQVLEARPMLGRTIQPYDADAPGRSPVAVVGYRFWQQSLGSDPNIVGKTMDLNAARFTIVGVMPQGFHGLKQEADPSDLWVPETMADAVFLSSNLLEPRSNYFLQMFARSRPGVSMAAESDWLDRQIRAYVRAGESKTPTADREKEIGRLHQPLVPAAEGVSEIRNRYSDALGILMAIVALVLLIACANLANLLLARTVIREREIATRLALGSSRLRIVRQSLMEALVLSLTGGAMGLAVAFLVTRGLIAFVSRGTNGIPLSAVPDAGTLLFTLGVSLFAGLLFGLAPALRIARSSAGPVLNAGTRTAGSAGGRDGRWWPRALVTGQITLCLLLLVGAGLFLRTLARLEGQNFGFDNTHLVFANVDATLAGYKPEQAPALNRRILERLAAIPGVRAAALSDTPPMSYGSWNSSIHPQGYTPAPHEDMSPILKRVSGDYFAATSTPIVAGRAITPEDTASSQKVVVISQAVARHYFPKGDALGHTLTIDIDTAGPWMIVGIAADTLGLGPRRDRADTLYLPLAQLVGPHGEGTQESFASSVTLRTTGSPDQAVQGLRAAIASIDPNLPVLDVRTVQEQMSLFLSQETLVSRLAALFAGLAVLLAAIGLYGVMSFNMVRRVHEIGIRMALGAGTGAVQWMVLRESLVLFLAGIAIGLPAALGLANLLRHQLFQMSPFDPVTFAVAIGGIALVTLLSAWLPARRAARVDPMTALRCD
ncbi:ABC transporter permease [Silvibacterium dinghuense]|uniref:ABC transporter permease n=1 Tax=Silvibacterium dinghuense TaxID=1560006 RepID=A0A4Q1SIH5_9BACT|nr:ABC transporter permease [Silvibacterium dinghuense]RXS97030.1 ABC transporter permease [Silvibacterium dinghuense]GGG95622.1 hypothetical protein GCM10011586_08360 [Silvibacterium dinghuense]